MRARIQKISRYAPSIFQGKIDFSSARRSFSLTVEHPFEPAILRILAGLILLLGFAYVYFVGATILNVVARKDAMSQSASLTSAVSNLEREYFALSHELGPDDGTRLGLAPVSDTVYVHRPGNTALEAHGVADTNEI